MSDGDKWYGDKYGRKKDWSISVGLGLVRGTHLCLSCRCCCLVPKSC